jgi:hypothetical protein
VFCGIVSTAATTALPSPEALSSNNPLAGITAGSAKGDRSLLDIAVWVSAGVTCEACVDRRSIDRRWLSDAHPPQPANKAAAK